MPTCSRNKDIVELRNKLSTEVSIALVEHRDYLHRKPCWSIPGKMHQLTCWRKPIRRCFCSPQQLLQYPLFSHWLLIWPPLPRSHTACPQ